MADDSHNRFALITNENYSGYLWIATILCLSYSCLVLLVRLHIKWNLYGLDDLTATIATILQLAGGVPMFLAMKHGLGKDEKLLSTSAIDEAGKDTFIAEVFIIASLATAKSSVAALMLRLFTRDLEITKKPWMLCNGTLVLIGVWGLGSIITISIGCPPSQVLWESSLGYCDHQLTRWRIIVAIDILTELLLVALPILFIWDIQMKLYIKFQVVIAFGLRLPVAGFAGAHLHSISDYTSGANTSRDIIPALAWLQIELFWALLAATIPTLKAFMKSFNSGFGMEIDLDGYGSVSGGASGGDSRGFQLRRLPKSNGNQSLVASKRSSKFRQKKDPYAITTIDDPEPSEARIRPDIIGHKTSIYHTSEQGQKGSESVKSDDGSQEMIIKREVGWTVWHEDSEGPSDHPE